MRELARWIVEDLVLPVYLLTAQSRRRTNHLLESCRAPRGLFLHVYTSTEVGWPKSHQKFWRTVRERVDVAPHQAVCIEDSLSIGANALRSGMALILVDRDGASRAFIEQELGGHLANAPLLQVGERFPVEEPFVVCARSPKEIQRCIQAMRYVPREGR